MLEESLPAVWSSMNSWFTPTLLFLILNVVIGTVVIASNFGKHQHHHQQEQAENRQQQFPLFRTPSLLQRVRSINLYGYKSDDFNVFPPTTTTTVAPPEPQYITIHEQQPQPSTPRKAAVQEPEYPSPDHLQKDPYEFLDQFQPQSSTPRKPAVQEPEYPSPHHLQKDPYEFLDQFQSQSSTPRKAVVQEPEYTTPDHVQKDPYEFLDQFQSQSSTPRKAVVQVQKNQYEILDHHVNRTKSDTKPRAADRPVNLSKKMKKSASVKSAFGHFEEEKIIVVKRPSTVKEAKTVSSDVQSFGDDEEVDAKADDFINRFKNQLKLQRLDSIIRYKEMLGRGTHKAAE